MYPSGYEQALMRVTGCGWIDGKFGLNLRNERMWNCLHTQIHHFASAIPVYRLYTDGNDNEITFNCHISSQPLSNS
jgi:hypothetical protein